MNYKIKVVIRLDTYKDRGYSLILRSLCFSLNLYQVTFMDLRNDLQNRLLEIRIIARFDICEVSGS